ncbi:MAG: hypothetical protein C4527_06110 [Candidatus Omnitrophota bacterium]|jgi:hypothetical protein|nr:MAG: hypothetical protein C4527_06110 [Candidatus Omnitrophota bacterium]
MSEYNPPWEEIIRLHQNLKYIVLKAEELTKEKETYIQPILEQRDALDHFIRSKAAELGLLEKTKDSYYIEQQFEKMKGHLYRAFFDAADWASTSIRDEVDFVLSRYTHECIVAVIPEYYEEIIPSIDNISNKIALIRNGKDIAQEKNEIVEEVNRYFDLVDGLFTHLSKIKSKIRGLEDYRKRSLIEKWKNWIITLIIGVICIILGWLIN